MVEAVTDASRVTRRLPVVAAMTAERLRLVVFQETVGTWGVRGLEHGVTAQGTTIGAAVRAVTRLIEVLTAYDRRHAHEPLTAFAPAPQRYWNAFAAGTPLSLAQLGITPPGDWDIEAAFAARLPVPVSADALYAGQKK